MLPVIDRVGAMIPFLNCARPTVPMGGTRAGVQPGGVLPMPARAVGTHRLSVTLPAVNDGQNS
jgi:hypothetical protein